MEDFSDMATLALGIVTALVIPFVLWLRNGDLRKSKEQYEEQERKYQASQRKYEENERVIRDLERDYEERQQRYDEVKEVLDIHSALTQAEVISALSQASEDEGAKRLVVAAHARACYRFKQFSSDLPLPEDVAELLIDTLRAIHRALPRETAKAQGVFNEMVEQKQDHRKDATVQHRVLGFASHLVGAPVTRGETNPLAAEFRDIATQIRVTRGGQGIEFENEFTTDRIWFAGSGKGELPSAVHHADSTGCSLRPLKAVLQRENSTGESLAQAFVREVRAVSAEKATCGCGARLTFT